jgi:uncharacterized repeat protein (TIGR04052 family)
MKYFRTDLSILSKTIFVLAAGALLVACGDDGHNHDHADATPGDATYQVQFAANVNGAAAACGSSYDNVGTSNATVSLHDLRFYVTDVRLLSGTTETPLVLSDDDEWQDGEVVLIDLEDGTGDCATDGTSATNAMAVGTAADATYDGIAFTVGVPFDSNHADVTGAEPPLDVVPLYWAWAIGHKFTKIDFDVNSGAARWNVHFGSTMCDTPAMDQPPTAECARPNRIEIALTGFDPTADTVNIDIGALVADSDLAANTDMTAFGCQSFPDDGTDCTPIYSNMGLDFTTGACTTDCSDQSVFSVD